MKRGFVVLCAVSVLMVLAVQAGFSEDSRGRGFYFDVGLGFAGVNYTPEVDDMLTILDGMGADRTTVYLDLGLGYAVMPNLYVLGSVTGFGDRIQYEGEWMQLNTYLYGIGARYYPFNRGLQLGADVGLGKMLMQSSDPDFNNIASESGLGSKFTVAYDFDSSFVGPALLMGASLLNDSIEGETVTGGTLFVKFVYK